MKSFEPGVLERQLFPASLLSTVRLLGEHHLSLADSNPSRQPPARFVDRLRETALLASIESSNRLDGASITPERLREIVIGGAGVDGRAEQEIAGYRKALADVVREARSGDFTPQVVLRLHGQLYRFVPEGGGCWKMSDDLVTETLPDGSTEVVFTPVPAYAVEDAMNRLHEGFARHCAGAIIDPLLLIPAYLLDFLCIHPFSDGNDRMVRLLAPLLLERAGYHIATFVSLDPLFEQTRPACSTALQASWRGWHRATHDLAPWSAYFLGIVLQACQQFDREMDVASPPRGAKRDRVAQAVGRLPTEFRYADLERLVPSISRPTINRTLRRLRVERVVRCVRPGRNARWQRM
jgi:Fic family protein